MKNAVMVGGIILLLNLIASAQIPDDANLQIQTNNLSVTNFSGIISNTRPDVPYEFQYWQSRTNRISLGIVYGRETTNWTTFNFRTTNVINGKRIHVRSLEDSDGNGIADWWELRYFGTVGIDPYGNPEGDGWNNMQKYQNSMNPFKWYRPGGPKVNSTFRQGSDIRHENTILTWQCLNGPVPDYFIVERAERTLRRMTNNLPPYRRIINGKLVTNQPPNFHPPYGRPGELPQNQFITKPFEIIAHVPGQPNVRDYRYMDTNVDAFPKSVYRIQAHYAEPAPFAEIRNASTEIVRKTILTVTAKKETNGYALTVLRPALHVRYLLLVRDKNAPQWRASGYFVSGTNGSAVRLHVDKKGMMLEGQSPITMPAVNFLPDANQPEFTAGYGEDSDGDCLPDIYEVLVTHTDPANDDTGNTGTIDGFKKTTSDGVSNLEKFRCRVDPLLPVRPPTPIELKHPTGEEIMNALLPKTDLSCELEIEVRTNDAVGYQPIEQVPWMFAKTVDIRDANKHKKFDVRISWHFSGVFLGDRSHQDLPAEYRALEPLTQKIILELFTAFKANLETNPPRSALEVSNKMVELENSYRNGEINKGMVMAETILLQNYQSQDFYGKVIDQDGNPLANVSVTGDLTLNDGTYGGFNVKKFNTMSDKDGLFDFTNIRGAGFSVQINKEGYKMGDRGEGYKSPVGGKSTPSDRVILTMWKIRGPELLIHSGIDTHIPHDGTPVAFDLNTGKLSSSGGFQVTLSQYPLEVKHGWDRFNWSVKVEILNGGMQEENDSYPYWAPTNGYQASFEFNESSNAVKWLGGLPQKMFYIKTAQGQYGLMKLQVFAGRSPTGIQANFTINPSGSQNLEPDFSK